MHNHLFCVSGQIPSGPDGAMCSFECHKLITFACCCRCSELSSSCDRVSGECVPSSRCWTTSMSRHCTCSSHYGFYLEAVIIHVTALATYASSRHLRISTPVVLVQIASRCKRPGIMQDVLMQLFCSAVSVVRGQWQPEVHVCCTARVVLVIFLALKGL